MYLYIYIHVYIYIYHIHIYTLVEGLRKSVQRNAQNMVSLLMLAGVLVALAPDLSRGKSEQRWHCSSFSVNCGAPQRREINEPWTPFFPRFKTPQEFGKDVAQEPFSLTQLAGQP